MEPRRHGADPGERRRPSPRAGTGAVAKAGEMLGNANVLVTTGTDRPRPRSRHRRQKWSAHGKLRGDPRLRRVHHDRRRRVHAAPDHREHRRHNASTTFGGPRGPSHAGIVDLRDHRHRARQRQRRGRALVLRRRRSGDRLRQRWAVNIGLTAFDGTLAPVWTRTVAASGCGTTPADLLTRPVVRQRDALQHPLAHDARRRDRSAAHRMHRRVRAVVDAGGHDARSRRSWR